MTDELKIADVLTTFKKDEDFNEEIYIEAIALGCSVKKVFLEISHFKFNKVVGLRLKKRTWHRCFPVNFGKILGTPFSIEHFWWLLLK